MSLEELLHKLCLNLLIDFRTLRDAGLYKFWDKGRGIFFNEAKTFICWVNEEDHIRLISMETGGDIASVYLRLVKVILMVLVQIVIYIIAYTMKVRYKHTRARMYIHTHVRTIFITNE
jgi:hypothetical protein